MQIRTVRKPGQRGTARLVDQYGEKLVCVRYRYDATHRRCFKTVELIVEESPWAPPPETEPAPPSSPSRTTPYVKVRIGPLERDKQRSIKSIGGQWDPGARVWHAPEEYVRRIGLAGRIVR